VSTATVSPVPDEGVVDDAQSVIAQLRVERSKLGAAATPLDVVIPGYDDLLLLRCKWVDFKELSDGGKSLSKITEPTEQEIAAAADALVVTCKELLIQVKGELKPLSQTSDPVTFGDPRLPGLLGFAPADTARDTVRAVFANDYALLDTANAVVRWLKDTTKRQNLAFLGK
jgi:hypothetical protein